MFVHSPGWPAARSSTPEVMVVSVATLSSSCHSAKVAAPALRTSTPAPMAAAAFQVVPGVVRAAGRGVVVRAMVVPFGSGAGISGVEITLGRRAQRPPAIAPGLPQDLLKIPQGAGCGPGFRRLRAPPALAGR